MIFLSFTNCSKETGNNNTYTVTVESERFSYVLYYGLSQSILEPIQTILDNNYSRVLNDLGVDSIDKVTVKIWNDETAFLDNMESALGIRYPGSGGWVRGAHDIRILYRGNYTGQIVLHEFCHAVSLIVNHQFGNNPRWLWEAVATYEAGEFVDPNSLSYYVVGNFPTVAELNSNFNTSNNKIYHVGYMISEYIIMYWDKNSYVNLIKSNGNILHVLEITNQEFEEGWKDFVTTKYFKK